MNQVENNKFFIKSINSSIEVFQSLIVNCLPDIELASKLMFDAVKNNKKIIWCGNGGSAADAQHMAAELMGGLTSHTRKPIESIALTTDSSFITAWANDTGYDTIFARQIEGLGKAGDVLIAITTSGNSKNIIEAIKIALKKKIKIIVITGKNGGEASKLENSSKIKVPSLETQRIQESHILIEHILCENLEKYFILNEV